MAQFVLKFSATLRIFLLNKIIKRLVVISKHFQSQILLVFVQLIVRTRTNLTNLDYTVKISPDHLKWNRCLLRMCWQLHKLVSPRISEPTTHASHLARFQHCSSKSYEMLMMTTHPTIQFFPVPLFLIIYEFFKQISKEFTDHDIGPCTNYHVKFVVLINLALLKKIISPTTKECSSFIKQNIKKYSRKNVLIHAPLLWVN